MSQWLHAGLRQAGFETVLLETRHVKAALSAMMVKTDRKDALGLAQLIDRLDPSKMTPLGHSAQPAGMYWVDAVRHQTMISSDRN